MARLGDVFEAQITGEWGNECTENKAGTKVLRTTNFTSDGIINFDNVVLRSITESKVEKKRLRYGDIILEKSGGTEKTPVGRVVFCDQAIEDDTYLCNNFTQALRVNQEVGYPRYVFYFMWYLHYSGKTDLLQNKTTGIRNLQVKSYLNEEIPLPSLEEQRRIAAMLDKVSDLIAKRRAQLDKLDLLVKARFVEMFGAEEERKTLSDICSIITDGTHQPPKFVTEGIPFLFVSNVVSNVITYETEKYISQETYNELIKRTPIEPGDILLSTVGSYGHPAIVKDKKKFLFQRHIAYLKPNHEMVYSEYLHSALLSCDVQRQIEEKVKGVAQKTLNLSEIKKISLPIPPINTQRKFCKFVEQVNGGKSIIEHSLDKLEILEKALMQQYFG